MMTAAHPTRLIRGSLCVPEPSPKMYVQASLNTPFPNCRQNPNFCVLHSPGSWHYLPETETIKCVFGLGSFVNEVLCLVKNFTCVGSTLPNAMVHVLVLLLASRAYRRLHQPCSVTSLLRLFTCSLPFNACGQMTKSVPDAPRPVRTQN